MDYSIFAEVKIMVPASKKPIAKKRRKKGENYQMKLRALNFRIKVHLRSYGGKMKGKLT